MRFSVVVAGFFAAVASAQSSTETDTAVSSASSAASGDSTTVAASTTNTDVASLTSVSIDPAQTSAQAAIIQCINACDVNDVDCKAKCIAVPSPDTTNVNRTTECVAACPQGNGTAADNDAYSSCVSGCIAQYYYTSTGTPNLATSSGASGSAATPSVTQVESTVTSDGSTFVTSFSSTIAPSGSDSAASASSTSSSSAGADMLFSPVGTGFGLFSFLAAFLAL
ncbi:hypothetical protein K449DRAFT_402358 [Hypoxylon sp. EC38]|nr:hypothetical protein K449DRAFT_402358 [Hypoxylon sp. EC38]